MELMYLLTKLSKTFKKHGYSLYAVGGTTRDFLLYKELNDFDFVTDATPQEMAKFLDNYNDVFSRFGVMLTKVDGVKVEITTLREEKKYTDSRHPSEVLFIKELERDYLRRDFTINALYLDENGKVYDYCEGLKDLESKTIRMIGDITQRIKEDPLRILRALRFSLALGFAIEKELDEFIKNNIYLLGVLNKEKIKQEVRKMENVSFDQARSLLNKYNINLFNLD